MASPSSAASSPHSTMQFLSSLLSQRGPNALPYSEDVKLLIRQHLLNLMQELPSLRAKPASFVHNDGTSANLLQVDGTVPMTFHGASYNIPVIIWLLESYPKAPPRVFVSPTKDMIIKRPHKHVDASGMVSLPYLQSWFYPRSNLADLARALSSMFSQDPPLFSKPSSPSSNHRTNSAASPASGAFASYTSSPLSSPARPHMQPVPPSPHRTDSPGSMSSSRLPSSRHSHTENGRSGHTDSPSEVFRRNAINSLVERLKQDTSELRKAREKDLDELFTVQSHLKQRKDQLNQGIQNLQQEKGSLEQQLQILRTNTDLLGNWLKEQGKPSLEVDVDDAFLPYDALSKQMLESTSVDLALEDVLYSLDKAVQEGSVPVDVYLKQVRSIAREQFFHRAISAKIQACQIQIHLVCSHIDYAVEPQLIPKHP
ncbi:hypothetical protein GOP47_0022353 [Adiantum capillus-veneris]|uniref:Uncharacterized protein n=1 Tax=Adiantum capillus-veneris TaxID=13818 RepID=A0A9D4U794_ADICA|nr:hypothetical protein GOP47_0022353 [Adiantum capillus-veneris]